MGRWLRHAGATVLLVMIALCRPQDAETHPAPFPSVNGSVFPALTPGVNTTNSSSANGPPNPCIDKNFLAPVYQIDNLTVTKTFRYDDPFLTRAYLAVIQFTMRDLANQYTLLCTWGPGNDDSSSSWESQDCVPESSSIPISSQTVALLNIKPEFLMMNRSNEDPVRFVQYWYCDITNGSYPQPYQSRMEFFLDVNCPLSGQADVTNSCLVSTPTPLNVKSQWQPTGHLPGTPRLTPKLTSPVPPARGLSPPPTTDCTDISFTHPDWELSAFSFLEQDDRWRLERASLNFTLQSRASGARAMCRFGGDHVATDAGDMLPLCTPEPAQPNLRSSFETRFQWQGRSLEIWERWVCGDVHGKYSTNFTATAKINVPTYRNGTLFVADPMIIRGKLPDFNWMTPARIPGPPGASNSECTTRSLSPGNDLFAITKFLYQTTKLSTDWAYNRPPGLQPHVTLIPYNRTLELEFRNEATGLLVSCAFNDPILDNVTDKWWPCPVLQQQQPRSTQQRQQQQHEFPVYTVDSYFTFNRDTRTLVINQTWYCNDTQNGTPFKFSAAANTSSDSRSPSLIAGSSNSTAYYVQCGMQGIWQIPIYCDVTYSARWVSLGGHKEGRPGTAAMGMRGSNVTQEKLPMNALTSPDPIPRGWSCTVSSLGHGPVEWTLRARDWMVITPWFEYLRSDQPRTKLRFDLVSSVFKDKPGSRPIRGLVTQSSYYGNEGTAALTPWLKGWDPTTVFKNVGRNEPEYYFDPGFDFYEFLGWSVRFDAAAGYLELSHSWYCDDKNPQTPYIFTGTWNGYLAMNCTYNFGNKTGYEDGVVCLPPGGEVTVTPTVEFYTTTTTIPDPTTYVTPRFK